MFLFFSNKLSDALLEDALHLLKKSLLSEHLESFPVNLSCQKSNHWASGAKVVQNIKEVGKKDIQINPKLDSFEITC